jgi:hypothetical protein
MSDPAVRRVSGVIEWADGELLEFALSSEGTSRWGAVMSITGRGVPVCEAMQKGLVEEGMYESGAKPGARESWCFEAIADTSETIARVQDIVVVYREDPARDEGGYWYVETSDVADILEAWQSADPERRGYRWPETERADDPAVVSFVATDGTLAMDTWPAADENEFPIDKLRDGELLPRGHYRFVRQP